MKVLKLIKKSIVMNQIINPVRKKNGVKNNNFDFLFFFLIYCFDLLFFFDD